MEHPARAGRGQRRAQPLEVFLRGAKAAEEWESVAYSLAGDQPDQGVVDAARFRADLHHHRRLSSFVRMETVLWRRSDDGRGERGGTALPVRAGAEDRVGETDGARFCPGEVIAKGGAHAEQVWCARVG